MNSVLQPLRAGLDRWSALIRLLWSAARWRAVVLAVCAALGGLAPVGVILATGRVVAELPGATHAGLGSAPGRALLGAIAGLLLAAAVLDAFADWLVLDVTARCDTAFAELVAEALIAPPLLSELETETYRARLAGIEQAEQTKLILGLVPDLRIMIGLRVTGLASLAVLLSFRWWAAPVLLAAWIVVNRQFTAWIGSGGLLLPDRGSAGLREARYLLGLVVDGAGSAEARFLGLGPWLVARHREAWTGAMRGLWRARGRGSRSMLIGLTLVALAHALVLGALAAALVGSGLSAASALVLAQAVLGSAMLGPVGKPQWTAARAGACARLLFDLRRDAFAAGPHPDDATDPPSPDPEAAIMLDRVAFRYPGSDRPVLRDVSLRIPQGQSVAIVGANGAGKSTLAKLLCGLYEPDTGRIRLAGRPAAVFQDFVRYPVGLLENVLLGADGPQDAELARRALTEAGGGRLLDSPASRTPAEDGTEPGLSGGQWQTVALARALAAVRAGARLLVLDEPAAHLDVRAESALFERFLARSADVTSVLITHRLASVRGVDRIIVLDQGTVIEDGTHEQLMAAHGRYHEMFSLQAERFAEQVATS